MPKITLFLLLAFLAMLQNLKADQYISLNDRETYDYLEYLAAKGEIELKFSGSKPYSAARIIKELEKISSPSVNTARFIEKFKAEYISTDNRFLQLSDANSRLSADPLFSLNGVKQTGESLSKNSISDAVSNTAFKVEVTYRDWLTLYSHTGVKINHLKHMLRDDLANQQSWQFNEANEVLSEDYTETYLKTSNGSLEIALGKFPVSLGSGYMHSLTLSPQKYYFENLLTSWQFSDFKFTTVSGFLTPDNETLFEIRDSTFQNDSTVLRKSMKRSKYLASHRLEWQPSPKFSFAVNEAVIYGDRPAEPGYLLPYLPLRWMEHYYGDQDNATMSFDFKYRPLKKVTCYGELFVDDETFTKSFTEFYGNKWAVLGGIYLADVAGVDNLNLRAEASRIEAYVYTHKYHINRYMSINNFLGGKYGPDSESYEFKIDYRPLPDLYLQAGYEHANVGEPLLHKEDEPEYSVDVKHFLNGTVEKYRLYTFSANYYYSHKLQLNCYYSHQDILNYAHESNASYVNNTFSLGFTWIPENYYKKYFQ